MSKKMIQIGEQVFTVFQNRLQKMEVVEELTENKKHMGTRTYYKLAGPLESECWRTAEEVFASLDDYIDYLRETLG